MESNPDELKAQQSLLTRFSACAERLDGTGAPPPYAWLEPGAYACSEAIECGFVCWAMDVAGWSLVNKGVGGSVTMYMEMGTQIMFTVKTFDKHGSTMFIDTEWMQDSAWCSVLEAICNAIGEST